MTDAVMDDTELRRKLMEFEARLAALETKAPFYVRDFDADGSAEYQVTEGRNLLAVAVDVDWEHEGVTYSVEDRGPDGLYVVWIGGNPTGVKVTFLEY